MTKEEFREFTEKINRNAMAHGLKGRETTDAWIDMAWPCFNGYTLAVDGVSKEDFLTMLGEITM